MIRTNRAFLAVDIVQIQPFMILYTFLLELKEKDFNFWLEYEQRYRISIIIRKIIHIHILTLNANNTMIDAIPNVKSGIRTLSILENTEPIVSRNDAPEPPLSPSKPCGEQNLNIVIDL